MSHTIQPRGASPAGPAPHTEVEGGCTHAAALSDVMPFHILVVSADPTSNAALRRVLSTTEYLVTYVTEFDEGRQRLQYAFPDLLITTVKLGAYNGLHLVLRARSERPDIPAIVLHTDPDPVLALEAQSAGAEFLTTPLDEAGFAALVEQLLAETTHRHLAMVPRRWPRKQVAVPARIGGNDATVVDVSYGGLRVEIEGIDQPLARLGTVDIPNVGALPVHPVWARGGGGGGGRWWCGAEVDMGDADTCDVWRRFVDSLN